MILFCKNTSYFIDAIMAQNPQRPYQFFLLAFYEDGFYKCFREYNKAIN